MPRRMSQKSRGRWKGWHRTRTPPEARVELDRDQYIQLCQLHREIVPAYAFGDGRAGTPFSMGPMGSPNPPKFFSLISGRSRVRPGQIFLEASSWWDAVMSWRTSIEYGELPRLAVFQDSRPNFEAHITIGWSRAGLAENRALRRLGLRSARDRKLKSDAWEAGPRRGRRGGSRSRL